MKRLEVEFLAGILTCLLLGLPAAVVAGPLQADAASAEEEESFLSWSRERALAVGRSTRAEGRAGNFFDTRIRNTERSYKYELRVTWMTPEVIRATARMIQIEEYLTDQATRALVKEAVSVPGTVMLVEIDPKEGSGVIPLDWLALLRPPGVQDASRIVRGASDPSLRRVRALQGVVERDYAYDRFWIVFPFVTDAGNPLFPDDADQAELIVRIHDKEEHVTWPIPPSVRRQIEEAISAPG